MSVRRLDPNQPKSFRFTPENLKWAKDTIRKYPKGREASAVILLLWRAQEQHDGWLPKPAMEYVANMLGMSFIRVYEVATFYTMFQLSPVGKKAHIQVCGTTPCMLRGAEDLIAVCKRRIAAHAHELSENGDMSWEEVECLGACVNAPMVQVFKDTYEDLTPEALERIIDDLAAGKTPRPGPQIERHYSAPAGGFTSLTDPALYGARAARPAKKAAAKKAAAPTAKAPAKKAAPAARKAPAKKAAAKPAGPERLAKPRGTADDLKLIAGVGPKLEQTLNKLGFWHFEQIAKWTKKDIAIVDDELSFKGRIDRDDWVNQARSLAKGGEAEYIRVFGKKPR